MRRQKTILPFRELSPTNWSAPDPILRHLVWIRPDGSHEPVSGDFLAEGILSIRLNDAVPPAIRALFEVARGSMCYGYYFYPLYALGAEQLYRVAEAALKHRCQGSKRTRFVDLIGEAISARIVPEDMRQELDAIRQMRNYSSHPEDQTILWPGDAKTTVDRVGLLLNTLFPDESVSSG